MRLIRLLLATRLDRRRRLDEAEEADARVLEQRREDHDEAGYEEDVDALEVGDLGQRSVGARQDRRHREHGRDAERDARRRRVAVQPERDPRQNDDETRRNVDVYDVVTETANKVELAGQPRVLAYNAQQSITLHIAFSRACCYER